MSEQKPDELSEIFSKVGTFSAPPFLAARVLAIAGDRKKRRPAFFSWPSLALGCSFLLVALVVGNFYSLNKPYDAIVDREVAIWVDGRGVDLKKVAAVEMKLPDGVVFYSSNYPGISELRNLTLEWSGAADRRP